MTFFNNTNSIFPFGVVEIVVDFINIGRDPFNLEVDPSAEKGAFELPNQ